MKITIRNKAKLPKKYIRFIKWKLYSAKEKFNHLSYSEVHLNSEGHPVKTFIVNTRLGIPGSEIIIKHQSKYLNELFKKTNTAIHRYLEKTKPLKKNIYEVSN